MIARNYNTVQNYISHDVITLACRDLDEFESNLTKSIAMSIDLILNTFLKNVDDHIKANRVFELTNAIQNDCDKILLNLTSTLPKNTDFERLSNDFLGLYFNLKDDVFAKNIANTTFIKLESSHAVIRMSSVLILCYLSKNNIQKNNLISYFDEAALIEKASIPDADLSIKKIEVASKNIDKKELKQSDLLEESEITYNKKRIFGFIAFLILVIGIGYYFYQKPAIAEPKEIITKVESQPQNIEGESVVNLGDFVDFNLPSDEIITIPEKGIEKSLIELILDQSKSLDESNYWLCFDRIHFENRDENYKIDSEEQIKNISLILASFPKVAIQIGCYTDNLGNPHSNLELTQKRAESIKNGLVKLGISENRVTTVGFGEGFAIAANDNDVNRKLNRRISLKVIKK